jgi:hypothetical protein
MLDADPLAAVSNTRRIDAVFLDGRFMSREELTAMLEKVDARYN